MSRHLRNIERTDSRRHSLHPPLVDIDKWMRAVEDATEALGIGRDDQPKPATHTHGLDDVACPERLVGECVIEREVAHAVALERERVAALAEQRGLHVIRAGRGRPMVTWRDCEIRGRELTDLAEAIRNGAHDGGRDDA